MKSNFLNLLIFDMTEEQYIFPSTIAVRGNEKFEFLSNQHDNEWFAVNYVNGKIVSEIIMPHFEMQGFVDSLNFEGFRDKTENIISHPRKIVKIGKKWALVPPPVFDLTKPAEDYPTGTVANFIYGKVRYRVIWVISGCWAVHDDGDRVDKFWYSRAEIGPVIDTMISTGFRIV